MKNKSEEGDAIIFVEGLILGLFLGSIGSALVVCFFIGAGASRR